MTRLCLPCSILALPLGALALLLAGCGSGSPDVSSLPPPKPISGQNPQDVAKAKGLSAPSAPARPTSAYDPTRTGG